MTNKKTLSLTSIICRNEEHLAAEIDDELVLMAIQNGNYYGLDIIASDIWRRLEKPATVTELCNQLAKEYDADTETIERDLLALFEKLEGESLIKVTP